MAILKALKYKFMFKLPDISEIKGSKGLKKWLKQFKDQMKKAEKSTGKLELNFP